MKYRSAIDAIAAVYSGALGTPAQREGAGDRLRLFIAQNNSIDYAGGPRPLTEPGLAHRFAHQRANPWRLDRRPYADKGRQHQYVMLWIRGPNSLDVSRGRHHTESQGEGFKGSPSATNIQRSPFYGISG